MRKSVLDAYWMQEPASSTHPVRNWRQWFFPNPFGISQKARGRDVLSQGRDVLSQGRDIKVTKIGGGRDVLSQGRDVLSQGRDRKVKEKNFLSFLGDFGIAHFVLDAYWMQVPASSTHPVRIWGPPGYQSISILINL